MTADYTGTREERFARLDLNGRRCDANSRSCVNSATHVFVILKADGSGVALPDSKPDTRQSCAWHRRNFADNGAYHVLSSQRLPERQVARPLWRKEELRQANT